MEYCNYSTSSPSNCCILSSSSCRHSKAPIVTRTTRATLVRTCCASPAMNANLCSSCQKRMLHWASPISDNDSEYFHTRTMSTGFAATPISEKMHIKAKNVADVSSSLQTADACQEVACGLFLFGQIGFLLVSIVTVAVSRRFQQRHLLGGWSYSILTPKFFKTSFYQFWHLHRADPCCLEHVFLQTKRTILVSLHCVHCKDLWMPTVNWFLSSLE